MHVNNITPNTWCKLAKYIGIFNTNVNIPNTDCNMRPKRIKTAKLFLNLFLFFLKKENKI